MSTLENTVAPSTDPKSSSTNGSGCASRRTAALALRISMHSQTSPESFRTGTIGETH